MYLKLRLAHHFKEGCLLKYSISLTHTVLSRASAHVRSQIKCQNLRVGGYMENSLESFNYPHAMAHPGCKVSCHGTEWTYIVGSSDIRRGQSNSGESCILLQSGPTCSLVAKFLQHSVVGEFRAAGEERCKRGHGRVCANLWCQMLCRSPDLHTFGFTTREFSMVGGYTENLEKPQSCQNWGVGACTGMGACSGQYGNCASTVPCDVKARGW